MPLTEEQRKAARKAYQREHGLLDSTMDEISDKCTFMQNWYVAVEFGLALASREVPTLSPGRKCHAMSTPSGPQECDFPHCGCDPVADRVIEALIEEGWQSPRGKSGWQEKYEELVYAVSKKIPDETRHQTALRYIKNAESSVGSHCGPSQEAD